VPGSITQDEFRALLTLNRMDAADRAGDRRLGSWALLEKRVDALIDYEEMTPAELLSEGRRILVMRLSDFGVRPYSLNLIVNDAAWASPEKRAIARKVVEAVQEGYSLVNERPADARRTSRASSRGCAALRRPQHGLGRPAALAARSAARPGRAGRRRSTCCPRSSCWPSRSRSTKWRS
jgi:hypothetical protein